MSIEIFENIFEIIILKSFKNIEKSVTKIIF
jgi:hypothetical protein